MSKFDRERARPAGHVPYDVPELPGKAPADAASPEMAEKNAEAAIRKLMSAQKRELSRAELPPLAGPAAAGAEIPDIPASAVAQAAPAHHPRRSASNLPPLAAAPAKPRARRGWRARLAASAPRILIARLRAYRPTGKHVFWAAVALIMLIRPWLIPTVLFVIFWVALIAYLTLGPDRVAELVSAGWERLRRRSPGLADRIRKRADRTAVRVDAVLDKLPGEWKEGLYMPDFSEEAVGRSVLDERPDPFDRIEAERTQG